MNLARITTNSGGELVAESALSAGDETCYRFAAFEVDFRTLELRKHGLKIKLQEKPVRILQALLERPGMLVTREELRQRLWPKDVYVDFERNLTSAMNKLRVALNDSAEKPRYIETLPRRGYRFIAAVEEVNCLQLWREGICSGSRSFRPSRPNRGTSSARPSSSRLRWTTLGAGGWRTWHIPGSGLTGAPAQSGSACRAGAFCSKSTASGCAAVCQPYRRRAAGVPVRWSDGGDDCRAEPRESREAGCDRAHFGHASTRKPQNWCRKLEEN
jgi:DNA-binding winged helix-turn-helix (wHTH) protein